MLEAEPLGLLQNVAASDRVRFGMIGIGMQGSGLLAGAIIPELVKVFTSTESRHVKEVVSSAEEGGASLGILSGFVAGNFSAYYLGLAMVVLMAVGYLISNMGLGGLMIAWGLVVSTIDNFIKPWLIGFGVQMPLSLTLLGVLGGFATFGFLGLFIGPTLIAVLFTLLQAWREAAADS
ncbi:AI-2E family transporter [Lacticaseibacillus rhamnosus]